MANSKVIIEIESTAKGLKISAKETEKLGKAVEKTGQAYEETGKASNKFHKKEKGVGQAQLSTAKGFSKMKETMGKGSSG